MPRYAAFLRGGNADELQDAALKAAFEAAGSPT